MRGTCTTSLISLLFLTVSACAGEAQDDWTPRPDDPTLIRALVSAGPFEVWPSSPDGRGSMASAVGELLSDDESSNVRAELWMNILGGHIEVRATTNELLVVEALTLDLDDVNIDAAVVPPRGVALTGLSVSLSGPVVVQAEIEEEQVGGDVYLDLVAEWAIDLGDGRVHPLNPVRIQQIPSSIVVERNLLGQLRVGVQMDYQGPFWSWLERFQLSDLQMSLIGSELAEPRL